MKILEGVDLTRLKILNLGGNSEPLLNPQILQILAICRELNIAVEVAFQVYRHRPYKSREPQPAGDLAALGVIQFALKQILCWSPCHVDSSESCSGWHVSRAGRAIRAKSDLARLTNEPRTPRLAISWSMRSA